MLELREKRMPEADDEFARSLGAYEDLAALREEISSASSETRSTGRGTSSPTGSSSSQSPTPRWSCPTC